VSSHSRYFMTSSPTSGCVITLFMIRQAHHEWRCAILKSDTQPLVLWFSKGERLIATQSRKGGERSQSKRLSKSSFLKRLLAIRAADRDSLAFRAVLCYQNQNMFAFPSSDTDKKGLDALRIPD
jgi:hypothetical protein